MLCNIVQYVVKGEAIEIGQIYVSVLVSDFRPISFLTCKSVGNNNHNHNHNNKHLLIYDETNYSRADVVCESDVQVLTKVKFVVSDITWPGVLKKLDPVLSVWFIEGVLMTSIKLGSGTRSNRRY